MICEHDLDITDCDVCCPTCEGRGCIECGCKAGDGTYIIPDGRSCPECGDNGFRGCGDCGGSGKRGVV